MAGKGLRLLNAGYDLPKPLVEVKGKTIAEWAISTIGLKGNFIFCCKNEHVQKFDLDKKLSNILPDCKIIVIDEDTEGTADTILRASEYIDNDDELSQEYVTVVPTFLFFKDGELVKKLEGADYNNIVKQLDILITQSESDSNSDSESDSDN